MDAEVWNGESGGARWWARALSFAAGLGLLLGIVGPFGSYLNGDALLRIGRWTAALLIGTTVTGLIAPPAMRLGAALGLPRPFSLSVALLVSSAPTSVAAALTARSIWPRETASLRPADWYGQTLLVTACVVALWGLLEAARGVRLPVGAGPADTAPQPDAFLQEIAPPPDPVLCLQMEDHYVRVHRRVGSSLELLTLSDAIGRYGAADGLQVHRGWWVAAGAVQGAERDGRNWQLRLANGLRVPVGRQRLADARARMDRIGSGEGEPHPMVASWGSLALR